MQMDENLLSQKLQEPEYDDDRTPKFGDFGVREIGLRLYGRIDGD